MTPAEIKAIAEKWCKRARDHKGPFPFSFAADDFHFADDDDANNQNHRLQTGDRPFLRIRHDAGSRETTRNPCHRNRAQSEILPDLSLIHI